MKKQGTGQISHKRDDGTYSIEKASQPGRHNKPRSISQTLFHKNLGGAVSLLMGS